MSVSIVFEGPEGVGKTTVAKLTELMIEETTSSPVLLVQEPGGTPAGAAIRQFLLFGESTRAHDPLAQLLLFTAARSELINERIEPFKKEHPNGIVIGDRTWPSSLAYQAVDGIDPEYIEMLQKPFMSYPDVFFYLDLPPEESLVRVATKKRLKSEWNWRDDQPIEVYEAVRERYLSIMTKEKERVMAVGAFESPWRTALRARASALVYLYQDPECRESARKDMENLTLRELPAYIEANKGRFDYDEILAEIEETRRILGAESRAELALKLEEDWRSRGVEWPRFDGFKERR
jgi:dTMP kinase